MTTDEFFTPKKNLEILLSGMRDYQNDRGNPFVLTRLILGLTSVTLYFMVNMEDAVGRGKPNRAYFRSHIHRIRVDGKPGPPMAIVLLDEPPENEEGQARWVFPMTPEEFIPMMAEMNEPFFLMAPGIWPPVPITPEMVHDMLLPAIEESEAASGKVEKNIKMTRGKRHAETKACDSNRQPGNP